MATGAILGGVLGAATQGLRIAFGRQDDFSFDSLAADIVQGAFSGAAAGLGGLAGPGKLLAEAGKLTRIGYVAAQIGLESAGAAAAQAIRGDKFDPLSVLLAAVGAGVGGSIEVAQSASKLAKNVARADTAIDVLESEFKAIPGKLARNREALSDAVTTIGTSLRETEDAARAVLLSEEGLRIAKGALKESKEALTNAGKVAAAAGNEINSFKKLIEDTLFDIDDELPSALTANLKAKVAEKAEALSAAKNAVDSASRKVASVTGDLGTASRLFKNKGRDLKEAYKAAEELNKAGVSILKRQTTLTKKNSYKQLAQEPNVSKTEI